jgi:hypothetical protein
VEVGLLGSKHRADLSVETNIPEEHSVIIFSPEDGDSMFSPKRRYLPTCLDGFTTQKTNIHIFIAVRTSNIISFFVCTVHAQSTVACVLHLSLSS